MQIVHYASYLVKGKDVYGTAELLSGSGYLFRKDGERKATLVSYKDVNLMLYSLCAVADAQHDIDRLVGGLRGHRVQPRRRGVLMGALTFLQTLTAEVARMQAAHPEREGELARAHALILHGMVVPSPTDPATGQVLSSDAQTTYAVNGTCSCPAGQHGKGCKHMQAWKLYQHIARKVSAPEAPAAPLAPVEPTATPAPTPSAT